MENNEWIENPDREYFAMMVEAIQRNNGFCPCKINKVVDNVCPCLEFREGKGCHCNLYVKKIKKMSIGY